MDNSFEEIIDQLSKEVSGKETSLCIGTFDGVHIGHQKLFNLAKKYKKTSYSSRKTCKNVHSHIS